MKKRNIFSSLWLISHAYVVNQNDNEMIESTTFHKRVVMGITEAFCQNRKKSCIATNATFEFCISQRIHLHFGTTQNSRDASWWMENDYFERGRRKCRIVFPTAFRKFQWGLSWQGHVLVSLFGKGVSAYNVLTGIFSLLPVDPSLPFHSLFKSGNQKRNVLAFKWVGNASKWNLA